MRLTLRIDNMDSREDGGPMDYVSEGRGFTVGRHSQSDWHLPDKAVSRSQFEIRFEGGAVLLHDLSSAGTFVVGESHRVLSPRMLRHGERLRVGPYILSVGLESSEADGWGRQSPARGHDLGRDGGHPPVHDPEHDRGHEGGQHGPYDWHDRGEMGGGFVSTPPVRQPGPLHVPSPIGHPPGPSAVARQDIPPQGGAEAWRDELCKGMGLPPGALRSLEPQQLGRILLGITEDLMGLLAARAIIKRNVRSKAQTMIAPLENNPLKFRASAPEALSEMLSRPSAGFLAGEAAFRNAFSDLRRHETAMIAALQPALARLLEDLAPEAVEQRAEAGLFANRKARAWEVFVERWDAKTRPYENGMLDLFLTYFAESYDQAAGQETTPPLGGRRS